PSLFVLLFQRWFQLLGAETAISTRSLHAGRTEPRVFLRSVRVLAKRTSVLIGHRGIPRRIVTTPGGVTLRIVKRSSTRRRTTPRDSSEALRGKRSQRAGPSRGQRGAVFPRTGSWTGHCNLLGRFQTA